MKARSILLLLVLVFVAGVFVGIWLGWSAWKHKLSAQHIWYELAPNQVANIRVHPGDSLSLIRPDGTSTGLTMNFLGGAAPCTAETTKTDTCVIAEAAVNTAQYRFLCSSNPAGYRCLDPGVQPSMSPPPLDLGNYALVAFEHPFAFDAPPPGHKEEGPKPGSAADDPNPIQAWVACDDATKTTVVLDYFGKPLPPIVGSVPQTVYWNSSQPFTLSVDSYPNGFCSKGDPGVTNKTATECTLNQAKKSVNYSVTASNCQTLKGASLTTN